MSEHKEVEQGESSIGKLTHLFWGYNIVDNCGNVMRKWAFLQKYPEQAQLVIDKIYPKYEAKMPEETFDFYELDKEVNELIGFGIVRTKNFR